MSYRTTFWTLLSIISIGTLSFFYVHEKNAWEEFYPPIDPNWQPAPPPCRLDDTTLVTQQMSTSTETGVYTITYERPESWEFTDRAFVEDESKSFNRFNCQGSLGQIVFRGASDMHGKYSTNWGMEPGTESIETLSINGVPVTRRSVVYDQRPERPYVMYYFYLDELTVLVRGSDAVRDALVHDLSISFVPYH